MARNFSVIRKSIVAAGLGLALVVPLAAVSPAAASTGSRTLIVDQAALPGTYSTIQAAIDAATIPGDRVVVNDGRYEENLVLSSPGAAGAPIEVAAAGNGAVVAGTATLDAAHTALSGLTLTGLTATDGTIAANAVTVRASDARVTGLKIDNFRGFGIRFEAKLSANGYAGENHIYNTAGGIQISEGGVIEDNEIERINVHDDASMPGDAFRVFGSNVQIRRNFVHGTSKSEIYRAHADMVQSWDDVKVPTKNVLIEKNLFTGWYHQGLMLENDAFGGTGVSYISDWMVRNNVFDGFESWGILAGKPGGGIPNLKVHNNTFSGNAAGSYNGVAMIGRNGFGEVRNNIITGVKVASYFASDGARQSAGNNLLYNAPAPASSLGYDVLGKDPLFVDAAQKDFRLRDGSPAIDAGAELGLKTDLLGIDRLSGNKPDIGAHEYVAVRPPVLNTVTGVEYDTIQAAVDAAAAGNRILVRAGRYIENVVLRTAGQPGAPVVLTADSPKSVLVGTITVAAEHVAVENLTVTGLTTGGITPANGVEVRAAYASITNLDIENFGGWGIAFEPGVATDGYAAHNRIYNTGGGARVADRTVVELNDVVRINTHGDDSAAGDAFLVTGSDVVIRGNRVNGTVRAETGDAQVDMVVATDATGFTATDVTVENNVFTGWFSRGVVLDNAVLGASGTYLVADWAVRNNVFAGFESDGILAGSASGGIPKMKAYSNTFAGFDGRGAVGVSFVGTGGSGEIRNNILTGILETSTVARDSATATQTHNLVFEAPEPGTRHWSILKAKDPLFVDAAGGDYRLSAGSPAIDRGTRVGSLTDADGLSRFVNGTIDIGAYEFGAVPLP